MSLERTSPLATARRAAVELACVVAVLSPLIVCLASGLLRASLWLDEITYFYYEADMGLRASELGRPGSAITPHLGIFFFCDVQRLLHAIFRPLGLTLYRNPELYLRLSSVASYAIAALALYVYLKKRLPGRIDALLGAAAFSSTPILLHYAFEARVYAMATMLVVLTVIAVQRAAEVPSTVRRLTAVLLGLVTVQSHLWTVCLFGALFLVAGIHGWRARRLTPWILSALVTSLPALLLAGAQVLYMRATDPGAPLFPPFERQIPVFTLTQLLFSNFFGAPQTQFIVRADWKAEVLADIGSFALLFLAWFSVRSSRKTRTGETGRVWGEVAVGALFLCWLLAVGYGYYVHGRYHVPLMGAFFFAVTFDPTRTKKLLLSILIACNMGLLPKTIEAIRSKGNTREIAALILKAGDRNVSVVCQHQVSSFFPLPSQAMGLDFYLNVLHPAEPTIPIYQKSDLSLVTGRRGVYDLFAGGASVMKEFLRSMPEVWRRKKGELGSHVFVLDQVWNVEEGNRQSQEFAQVMLESGDREVVEKYYISGAPRTLVVEVRKKGGV